MADDKTNAGVVGDPQGDDKKVHPRASEFDIPKFVQEKHAPLINQIMETKSMDDKERQYWFHILPIMSDKQIDKLKAILNKEKSKLAEIDNKYNQKLQAMREKKVNHWEQANIKGRFEEIKQQETSHEKEEQAAEEALLKQLEDI